MNTIKEFHLTVQRTARYCVLGELSEQIRELWIVCHGYGQLASYFIRNFSVLEQPSRLIVAPEALSRFYLKDFSGRIGATWMTREDRESEILDQKVYLTTLYKTVLEELYAKGIQRQSLRVVVFGFSQGVTTVCRWLFAERDAADISVHRLILWAGGLPIETQWEEYRACFLALDPVYVYGDQDEFITPEKVQEQQRKWVESGITLPVIVFKGGHEINEALLSTISTTHDVKALSYKGAI